MIEPREAADDAADATVEEARSQDESRDLIGSAGESTSRTVDGVARAAGEVGRAAGEVDRAAKEAAETRAEAEGLKPEMASKKASTEDSPP